MKGNTKRGATLAFGTFGLKAMDSVWLTNRQIESARQALTRHMKRVMYGSRFSLTDPLQQNQPK